MMARVRWLAALAVGALAAEAAGSAAAESPGDVPAMAAHVDALRGAVDPAKQEELLNAIADLQTELRRRQGEVSFRIRYWHGLRLRILTPVFLIGLVGQLLFAGRFLVQWIVSVRRGVSTVPVAFWSLSVVGSCLVLAYGIVSKEPVIILGQVGLFVYLHNLVMIRRERPTGDRFRGEIGAV